MKIFAALCSAFLFLSSFVNAQDNNYTSAADSDPEAKALLDKARKKYDSYRSLEADFTLTLEIPEQPTEVQEGKMAQKGEQYRVELEDQAVYCDGEIIWLYLKNNNEVQINKVEEGEDAESLSPKDLLRIYEGDDYVYALGNAYTADGRALQEIEFKPLDRDSEYAKIRLLMDQKKYEPVSIKIFGKDGSRYTLELNDLRPNVSFDKGYFTFQPEKYPGIYVEDLRID